MQAVIQNLEAMGNTVEMVNGQNASNNGTNGHDDNEHDGNGHEHNDGNENGEGRDSHINVLVQHPTGETEELMVTVDEDEHQPLLGGKQLASSPGRM